jgi:hypothetical protein
LVGDRPAREARGALRRRSLQRRPMFEGRARSASRTLTPAHARVSRAKRAQLGQCARRPCSPVVLAESTPPVRHRQPIADLLERFDLGLEVGAHERGTLELAALERQDEFGRSAADGPAWPWARGCRRSRIPPRRTNREVMTRASAVPVLSISSR